MRINKSHPEWDLHMNWLQRASWEARFAMCERAHCGSLIVLFDVRRNPLAEGGLVIGQGFNGPPGTNPSMEGELAQDHPPPPRCSNRTLREGFKSDRTCCVHAEQRAIIDALLRSPSWVKGSTLYFCRADMKSNAAIPSGEPYCTICSKMALDAGLKYFVLWHGDEIGIYPTDEYNERSFSYGTPGTV